MANVLSVAKELVKLSLMGEEEDPLTNLRLQKLLYYAQAWSLVLRECSLFPDELEAWRYGPVAPTAYRACPDGHKASPIYEDVFASAQNVDGEDAEFVGCLWEAYSPFSAIQLYRMTHQEDPWKKTWGNRPADSKGNDPIPVSELEAYFGKQNPPTALQGYRNELRLREEEAQRKIAQMPGIDAGRLKAAAARVLRGSTKNC